MRSFGPDFARPQDTASPAAPKPDLCVTKRQMLSGPEATKSRISWGNAASSLANVLPSAPVSSVPRRMM